MNGHGLVSNVVIFSPALGIRYCTVQASTLAISATETDHRRVFPGCTINKIFVRVTNNTMDTDGSVQLLKNGGTVETIVIPAGTTGTFTADANDIIADGDELDYKLSPGGAIGTCTCTITTSFL